MLLKKELIVQPEFFEYPHSFKLESGATLPSFTIAYETYGKLSPARDNAILVCHALTKDAHMAGRHSADSGRYGWWEALTGAGMPLDTDRYFMICSNVIGGCHGSTGPATVDPDTQKPYGTAFPVLTIGDMVRAQRLLLDHLEVEQLLAVAGGCFGGMQALEWMIRFPARTRKGVVISTTESTSAHSIAVFNIMRRFIREDPDWKGGDYYDGVFPAKGLSQAILMGIPIWMNRRAMEDKFGRSRLQAPRGYSLGSEFAVEAFLDQTARTVVRQFDPNSLLYLTRAQEYFDLPGNYGSLEKAFEKIEAELLLISYRSDWRYPPEEIEKMQQVMQKLGKKSRHLVLESEIGHSAFLYDAAGCGAAMRTFLASSDS